MTVDRVSSINMSRILQMLYNKGTICRPDIAQELRLDRSTVSKMINSLVDRSVIRLLEKGDSTPKGGRKPVFLELNYDLGHVIGIELQTDFWYMVIVNLKGEILFSLAGEHAFESTIDSVIEVIALQAREASKDMDSPLLGVVVSVPGIVKPLEGIVLLSNPLNIYAPVNVASMMNRYFDVPVLIENDANSCCWAELFRQRRDTPDNFLCVLVEFRRTRIGQEEQQGIGVGLGIVINQHVHYGSSFSAGEFQSVFAYGNHSTQFSISDEEAARVSRDDDVLSRVFGEFSDNAALLVNVFNLSEIVIIGDLLHKKEEFTEMMRAAIQAKWPYDTVVDCTVRFADLGRETVAFGAACMFMQRLFSVPRYNSEGDLYPCGVDLLSHVHPLL
ncbi:ROK family protein [Spirochaeta dissipatitropha]